MHVIALPVAMFNEPVPNSTGIQVHFTLPCDLLYLYMY